MQEGRRIDHGLLRPNEVNGKTSDDAKYDMELASKVVSRIHLRKECQKRI